MKRGQITKGLKGRNYGLGFWNSGNFVFLPPSSLLVARTILTPSKGLQKIVEENYESWLRGRKDLIRRKRRVPKKEDVAKIVRERIKRKHDGVVKLWDRCYEDVSAVATKGSLSGEVPRKTRGDPYNVSVYGWRLDQTRIKVECQCNGSHFSSLKRGRFHVEYFCPHACALLLFAQDCRKRVRNLESILKEHNTQIRPFFNQDFADGRALAFFLLDRYLLGRTLYEIDRAIIQKQSINVFDSYYKKWFEEGAGDIGFYVFVSRNIFSDEEGRFTPKVLKQYFEEVANRLYNQGYKHNGFVIEFPGTAFETIAVEFKNRKGKRIRFVCWDDHPPLVVERRSKKSKRKHVIVDSNFNPFLMLEKDIVLVDDCTRRPNYIRIEIASGRDVWAYKEMYREEVKAREFVSKLQNERKRNFYFNLLCR